MSRCVRLDYINPERECAGCAVRQLPELHTGGQTFDDRASHRFASRGQGPHWVLNKEAVIINAYPREGLFRLYSIDRGALLMESSRLCELLLKLRMRGMDV